MIRNFEIIGEASRNIERVAPDFVTAHPELPLTFAYALSRNENAHASSRISRTPLITVDFYSLYVTMIS